MSSLRRTLSNQVWVPLSPHFQWFVSWIQTTSGCWNIELSQLLFDIYGDGEIQQIDIYRYILLYVICSIFYVMLYILDSLPNAIWYVQYCPQKQDQFCLEVLWCPYTWSDQGCCKGSMPPIQKPFKPKNIGSWNWCSTSVLSVLIPRCLDENISAPLCVRYVASPKFFYKVGKGGLIVPYKFLVGMLDQTTLTMSWNVGMHILSSSQ